MPKFVIRELQTLADSSDSLKRGKGRRGLDLLHEMQQENEDRVLVGAGKTVDYRYQRF